MAELALRLIITGRVQGVGFRAWTSSEAQGRGLRGWVRNRHDGSVEALVIGEPAVVEAMVAACRQGPRLARVVEIIRAPAGDDGSPTFTERATV